ncbi:UDP-3-O-(3-hydroxymyristoyl)glucosamine N-acyltransferase [Campylobacter sp. JMF_02 ED1]|uniref:UDP-3-O-(3-hydroxymyristoyl)glucosamine N-acyltransferase n=1 Tax=unclassified Campylobacter TaxID=2593542 RepID=UPI0022EA0E15|nr:MULTISPECIES: UDP-3-O-(3-hydroxymyristoyl)glucosamine N-acyltransferase [unclassified Campylobacter]MDA3049082.1 UDP-3-O-(3-hydroxymyristoyl)glucosamine N-acyltransferase [Campylobacter sp. JMF_15 NE4]MDA3051493.1 UDP-3-O-(3-hydroxymyristoyl)glucosamine N-acyltransferase [Campylobacter sp. JMF_02 ED1]
MKLSEIVKILRMDFASLGIEDAEITAINSLQNASGSELSYCDSEKNEKFIADSKACAILVKKGVEVPKNIIKVECVNPHLAFAILSKYFAKPLIRESRPSAIAKSAQIAKGVYIGSNTQIGERVVICAGAYIGDDVVIGDDCVIHPGVVIYNDTIIGARCHILANAVIGSDGFGYAHRSDGTHVKIYHNGNVVLEDEVEIGANTTIDRAVFGSTIISACTKIDNLVQIGHNCELGQNCLIVSQVGLAGSTILGRNVVLGGQAGSGGHVRVGDFVQVAARGGISKDLPAGKNFAGHPIMELKEWFKLQAKIARFFKDK